MITIPEQLLYEIISENLDYIVSTDILETYVNIKNITVTSTIILQQHYDEINQYSSISENDFFEYFTNGVASTIGRIIQGLFVTGDVAVGTLTSATGTGLSSYVVNMLTPVFGSAGWATMATGFMPLLLLVVLFAMYKKIKSSEVVNAGFMVKRLKQLSQLLNFPINERINTEFKDLIQHKCSSITEKNLRTECAINGYVKFLNEFVLVELVTKYATYLINNNENISEINSFHQLATFKSQSNSAISSLMNKFYSHYTQFLKGLKVNNSIIGDSFRLLNNTVSTVLKKVN